MIGQRDGKGEAGGKDYFGAGEGRNEDRGAKGQRLGLACPA